MEQTNEQLPVLTNVSRQILSWHNNMQTHLHTAPFSNQHELQICQVGPVAVTPRRAISKQICSSAKHFFPQSLSITFAYSFVDKACYCSLQLPHSCLTVRVLLAQFVCHVSVSKLHHVASLTSAVMCSHTAFAMQHLDTQCYLSWRQLCTGCAG